MALSKPKRSKSTKKKFVKKLSLFPHNVTEKKHTFRAIFPTKVSVKIESLEELSGRKSFAFSRKILFATLIFFGLQLCLLSGWYYLYHQTVLSFKTSPAVVADANLRAAVPTQIIVQKADINLPIIPAAITNGVWQTSDTMATHLMTSARPAEGGNIVMYGHNLRRIFGNLSKVEVGDTLTINTQDGKQYDYIVEAKSVVSPEDIEQVLPTDHEVLTVYTCTGFLDSKRLVVRALPSGVRSL